MAQSAGPSPHVAVLAFPFGSHAAPLLSITHRLASAAPNTLFSFFTTAQSNNSLQHLTTPNIKAYSVSDGVPEGHVFSGNANPVEEMIDLFMKVAYENFMKEIEVATAETGRKLSCLVTDAFLSFGKEMAEEIGVTWVPFYVSGASPLASHVHTDLIRKKFEVGGIIGREDETLTFIPGMSSICIRYLPEGILSGNLESVFARMLHQMGKRLPQATAVVANTFEELDPIATNDMKSKLKNFLSIGPFILSLPPASSPDTYGCLPWLGTQKLGTVAYISFGSVATPPPHEIAAIAESLEATKIPFIWSLRDKSKEHLPDGFLDRVNDNLGKFVPWAPQMDVLAHAAVGVFISHAGWNSLTESIACGVPMIVRPFFGDHGINARMVEEVWGIGLLVEGGIFTKNGLLSCLDVVLNQERGKKMKENVKALKEVAERAVGPEGSSTKNFKPLLDLVS